MKTPFYLLFTLFLWFAASTLTNNIGKQVLSLWKFPVSLTLLQFLFVSLFSLLFHQINSFTLIILKTTLPLSLFQILGHVFSSFAYQYVSVSFVHTLKALAPLFTVFIYRFIYNVVYSNRIYYALFPLTLGVMLVCSIKFTFHLMGFICALSSTLIFALQNIFTKKLFIFSHDSKLDKFNLLFYSSFFAVLIMFPFWLYYESSVFTENISAYILFLITCNGITHFSQTFLAFTILSMVSPVTYSIASLVKRIFVIASSIVLFEHELSTIQIIGLFLTFFGLYLYDDAKNDVAISEAALNDELQLPGLRKDEFRSSPNLGLRNSNKRRDG